MSDAAPLTAIEIDPDGPADASVIWLHGLGADGNDFAPIVPHLGLDPSSNVRFVFPHAPQRAVTINAGWVMPAWYDILDLDPRRIDERGVEESGASVCALIEAERRRGIDAGRIVLAGFSQGGAIALHVALRTEIPIAGVLALSTYLVCEETLEEEIAGRASGMRVFQAHGESDPMVPIELGRAARDRLIGFGSRVEWRTYPMQHEVSAAEIGDIGSWLRDLLV